MFVYFFLNTANDIIYIGRSKNLMERMQTHFRHSHLEEACIQETVTVLYSELQSENEMKVYEIYCISKFKPKYNKDFTKGGAVSFVIPLLTLKKFNLNQAIRC